MAIHADGLHTLLLSSQQFFFIRLNKEGHFTFANRCFLQQIDDPRSACIGQPFNLYIVEQDIEKYRQGLKALLEEADSSQTIHLRILLGEGQPKRTCWDFSLVKDASKGIEGLQAIGYALDAGPQEYKQIVPHQEIEDKQKILKAIYDGTSNVQFFVAPDYRILFFNKKAYENAFLLHQRELKIGDNLLDYVRHTANNIEEGFKQEFARALQGEIVIVESNIGYNPDMSFWFQSEYCPVYEGGLISGIAICISDICERKNYQQGIERQNKLLAHIAHIQSHKTRQPVSTILGLVSIFNKGELSAENEKLLDMLEVTARKLDGVIHEIVETTSSLDEKANRKS